MLVVAASQWITSLKRDIWLISDNSLVLYLARWAYAGVTLPSYVMFMRKYPVMIGSQSLYAVDLNS